MAGLDNTEALKALDSVLKAVLDADYLTSNLVTNSQVFIDATKAVLGDNPRLITELQFTKDNKAAGDLLQQTGKQLNLLIQAASKGEMSPANDAVKKLISSLKPVVQVVLQKVEELKEPLSQQGIYDQIRKNAVYLMEELIDTPGSITLKDSIGKNFANILKTGKTLPESLTKPRPKPIIQKHKEIVDISKVAKDFEKAAKQLKTAIKKSSSASNVNVKRDRKQESNLLSLTNLINGQLQDVISANMGDGSSKNILNYRSGRFASTVKVERLTQSREGMITAFYTYMKNPYSTFSAGGRQANPASRDPKLLIARSIREIVQQTMNNKLRAVSL
jgi:hypothetical protein